MMLKLNICPNAGYSAAQAAENSRTITVGMLLEMLEGHDVDTKIVTFDTTNGRGASWGVIIADQLVEEVDQ